MAHWSKNSDPSKGKKQPGSAPVLKHPQLRLIPRIYAWVIIKIKKTNRPIVNIDAPSKKTPVIKLKPIISSTHGKINAAKLFMLMGEI